MQWEKVVAWNLKTLLFCPVKRDCHRPDCQENGYGLASESLCKRVADEGSESQWHFWIWHSSKKNRVFNYRRVSITWIAMCSQKPVWDRSFRLLSMLSRQDMKDMKHDSKLSCKDALWSSRHEADEVCKWAKSALTLLSLRPPTTNYFGLWQPQAEVIK